MHHFLQFSTLVLLSPVDDVRPVDVQSKPDSRRPKRVPRGEVIPLKLVERTNR